MKNQWPSCASCQVKLVSVDKGMVDSQDGVKMGVVTERDRTLNFLPSSSVLQQNATLQSLVKQI